MGSSNQVAVVEEQEACSGFSLRRLATPGDTLAGLPVLRHHEKLELRQQTVPHLACGERR
jgi:hypothetical protein